MIYYQEPGHVIHQGHALDILRQWVDESVDCVITSPPYWGLRSYKAEPIIWDNHRDCEHEWGNAIENPLNHKNPNRGPASCVGAPTRAANQLIRTDRPEGNFCLKCGAWRGQLGLEPTIELYISHLLQIFDEVKRVLKKTGTLWVNIGDSYNSAASNQSANLGNAKALEEIGHRTPLNKAVPTKSLCLIPERFALGMVERSWILRNNIIWYKPNPMPESVKDRFTGSYEVVYFFVKSQRYWFERQFDPMTYPERVFNPDTSGHETRQLTEEGNRTTGGLHDGRIHYGNPELGRNKRDVWEIGTVPSPQYRGMVKNFATFPEALVEIPILAGCPSMICKKCGKARERIYESTGHTNKREDAHVPNNTPTKVDSTGWDYTTRPTETYTDCGCNAGFEPGVVLDPFAGSGTAGAVAKRLGRKYIGIDTSPAYCKLHKRRLEAIPLAMELTIQ